MFTLNDYLRRYQLSYNDFMSVISDTTNVMMLITFTIHCVETKT